MHWRSAARACCAQICCKIGGCVWLIIRQTSAMTRSTLSQGCSSTSSLQMSASGSISGTHQFCRGAAKLGACIMPAGAQLRLFLIQVDISSRPQEKPDDSLPGSIFDISQ